MDTNGHDHLRDYMARAEQERQAQEFKTHALHQAANNPHTVEQIKQSGVGLAEAPDGTAVLLVATLDGRRRDVTLSPDSERLLLRALTQRAAISEAVEPAVRAA